VRVRVRRPAAGASGRRAVLRVGRVFLARGPVLCARP
jgi:hypothetical protein